MKRCATSLVMEMQIKTTRYSHKKEWIWVSCCEVNELRACYTKWSKSGREKQISYINTYICNLEKWYWWTYLQGRNGDADVENRLWTHQWKERVGQTEKLALTHMHYYVYNRQLVGSDQISRPHESQHTRPPCPSPTPRVHSDSRPSSQWCHPAISFSVVPFSSCPQSLLASESFPMSQLFTWGGQSTGVSALASFLPKKSQGWFPSQWTGWISLQSKGLSRVFSNTTVQKHQFFSAQPSSQSNSHIHTWPLEKP